MKASFKMAMAEYKRWLFNSRAVMLIVLIIFAREAVGQFLCQHAADMNMKLQIFEPYIALCNSYVALLVTPIFCLVMMADFPVMEGSYMWSIYRLGKKQWIFSQVILSIMCSITIECCLFVSSIISCLGYIGFGNDWSKVITQYYLYFPDKAGQSVTSLISGDIYNQMLPLEGFVHTFFLSLLSMVLLSVILMCGKIFEKRYLAFVLNLILVGAGTTFRTLNIGFKWFFPSANAAVGGHLYEFVDKSYMPLMYSYIYFLAAIVIVVIISYIRLKRGNVCRKL